MWCVCEYEPPAFEASKVHLAFVGAVPLFFARMAFVFGCECFFKLLLLLLLLLIFFKMHRSGAFWWLAVWPWRHCSC
jgi:hypothetical protein